MSEENESLDSAKSQTGTPELTELPRASRDSNPLGFRSFLASIFALLGAVALSLWPLDIQESSFNSEGADLGYTLSLSLFIVPALVLGIWLFRRRDLRLARRAFWWTVLPWTVVGCSLDFLLASRLFCFPASNTVLPIPCIPILGNGQSHGGACPSSADAFLAGAPLEEFVFYTMGFIAVLLVYIWADVAWLGRYNPPDYRGPLKGRGRILQFDKRALVWGGGLLALGWIYKQGFPLYFAFLVIFSVVPTAMLFKTAVNYVNWRAFSFTFFWILLISLIWEVSLALPYGYWDYQAEAMLGLRIKAWHGLPIEAVLVWFSVTFATVQTFEVVKIWKASSRKARDLFLGI